MSDFDFEKNLGAPAAAIIAKYPQKRSAVMPLLHLVQEHTRHISPEAMEWIAAKLGLQPIDVMGLVTFYPSFKSEPMGKLHLRVCKTLSCMLAGADKTGHALATLLDTPMGTTRADGAVSIEWVECLACCDKAPVVLVNEQLETGITEDKAQALLAKYNIPVVAKA